MPARIFSVGYEGLDVAEFAASVVAVGVTTVVDVRLNAVSRRRGFSKKALEEVLNDVGVKYVHERDLGNPQDNREAFRNGDGKAGRVRMRAILSKGSHDALERVVALARTQAIAVMCVEREQSCCHRDVIIEMVQELEPTLVVRKLAVG